MKRLRFVVVALMMVMVFAWKFAPGVKAQSSTNLSAYEFLLGSPCTIDGEAGKCGVSFGGWMGGGGPVAGGTVSWPTSSSDNEYGCGDGVAKSRCRSRRVPH